MTREKDDQELEKLFSTARSDLPELTGDTVEKLVAAVPAPDVSPGPKSGGVFNGLRSWLPALGGLGVATALGVWIGVLVPTSTLMDGSFLSSADPLDLSSFYTGADPSNFLLDEAGL